MGACCSGGNSTPFSLASTPIDTPSYDAAMLRACGGEKREALASRTLGSLSFSPPD